MLRAVLAEKAHATRQAAAARSLAASVCVCLPIYRSKPVNVGTWGLDSLPLTPRPDDTRARPHSRVIDGTQTHGLCREIALGYGVVLSGTYGFTHSRLTRDRENGLGFQKRHRGHTSTTPLLRHTNEHERFRLRSGQTPYPFLKPCRTETRNY